MVAGARTEIGGATLRNAQGIDRIRRIVRWNAVNRRFADHVNDLR
jgi:hypothetical protein